MLRDRAQKPARPAAAGRGFYIAGGGGATPRGALGLGLSYLSLRDPLWGNRRGRFERLHRQGRGGVLSQLRHPRTSAGRVIGIPRQMITRISCGLGLALLLVGCVSMAPPDRPPQAPISSDYPADAPRTRVSRSEWSSGAAFSSTARDREGVLSDLQETFRGRFEHAARADAG